MSNRIIFVLSNELKLNVEEVVNKYPEDYNGNLSNFVRGAVIRRLRELGELKQWIIIQGQIFI